MIDYNKLCFESIDTDCSPIQVIFEYSRDPEDIEKFLLYGLGEDDAPEDDEIESIEFELFIFSMSDFKVECTLHGSRGDYFIGDYIEVMHNAYEWIEQIPHEEMDLIKSILSSKGGNN